ncbi:protein kinase domain-containing protein [Bryobacter aggregatus]|uniref:serine/threonine-protein kinase n=1 Tax=Bryobacter aggregatus TaxID=360054 RepID=UPI0004E0BA2F|nr:serine/threonine-protein kinase [Bryobacter aggregatus]
MHTRWQQVKQILHDAAEMPASRRDAFVEEASGGDAELIAEVKSLLESFEAADEFLEDAPVQLGGFLETLEGRRVGDYRVEKLIAKGGMGSVYLASKEMDGVPMQVALKVIRFAGNHEYLSRRFRMERQILARLTHENILRLLDGGVTSEGVPYLVTEYLDAQNLEEWLVETKPSLAARLELFTRICDGVAYAHRNLIVHGDLKPSNILVTRDGGAKLVDFGIARLIQGKDTTDPAVQNTITMAPALTPWWASPEQLRGEPLSIESDCYALGRILFFLLCGKLPFDFTGMTTQEILEHLRKEAPPKPSQVSGDGRLSGDLDNISLKALEFERSHRYRGADALGEDIERYLHLRPVSARPQTYGYRLQKFIRRNRAFVAVSTLASIALILAVGAAFYQERLAQKNYEKAQQRFDQLRNLANTLVFDADEALSTLQGATPVRAKLVKSALGYLDELAKQDTTDIVLREELAATYERIGDIQGRPGTMNLGQIAEALQSYRKSEMLRMEIRKNAKKAPEFQKASEQLASSYSRLSAALRVMGDANTALSYERKALGIRQALFEGDPTNLLRKRALASNLTSLSGSLSQMGDWQGVLETRREALQMLEEVVAQNPNQVADLRALSLALSRMGSIERHENALPASLAHYQRALEIDLRLYERDRGNVQFQVSAGLSHTNFGTILQSLGRTKEALDHFEVGRMIYEEVARADIREVRSRTLLQTNRVSTAKALLSIGRSREALPMVESALAMRERLAAMNRSNAGAQGEVAEAHEALGQVYAALRQRQKALKEFQMAQTLLQTIISADRSNAAMREDLARVENQLGALGVKSSAASVPVASSQ